MTQRRSIGEILLQCGRIKQEDVERALQYQRENGCFFGEALVSLGLVTREELDWGLASQYDLPYVFPDPESIDPEAAHMVSAEWALAHLVLPIMKTAETLTVVVDSPMRKDALAELQGRTELRIELALASPSSIRELIRHVFARPAAVEEQMPAPVGLKALLAAAQDAAAERFGISVRGKEALGWYEDHGEARRHPLEALWERELDGYLSPPPSEKLTGGVRSADWEAALSREGVVTRVQARVLLSDGGAEYLFRPVQRRSGAQDRFQPPHQAVLSEIRLLARSGAARFVLITDPPEFGRELLPFLPALTLDPSWRSVHVTDAAEEAAVDVFTVKISNGAQRRNELQDLRAFRFDVVTADLKGPPDEWAPEVLDAASVAFLLAEREEEIRALEAEGARWMLRVERAEKDRLRWSLQPLHR
ncbi:MAG: hypothetical protein HY704_04840 [Gemmatimonadetes bacterium]|nr:hypothetical protein [Gemmatimonadota bacterium]